MFASCVRFGVVGSVALAAGVSSSSAAVNVALGKDVSLVAGSVNGVALSTLTDGVYRPRGTGYQNGTVWWNGLTPTLEIDLGGAFSLIGANVQADDNDTYVLLYRDMDTGSFEVLWDVPDRDSSGAGMQTRPDVNDDSAFFEFAGPIVTDVVRVAATSGDNAYSLAEVALFVPAPGVLAAVGVCVAMTSVRRR